MATLDDAFSSFLTEIKATEGDATDEAPSAKRSKAAAAAEPPVAATNDSTSQTAAAPAQSAAVSASATSLAPEAASLPAAKPVAAASHVRIGPPGPPPAAMLPPSSSSSSSARVIGPAGPPPEAAAAAAASRPAKAKRRDLRVAAGKVWVDDSMQDWPENDFRLFVGDLAPEVENEDLARMFREYDSFAMARVVKDRSTEKSRGYGFVSMLDLMDAAKAIRDKNRKYLKSRPITVRWSNWKKRSLQSLSGKQRKQQMKLVKAARSMKTKDSKQ